MRTQASSQGINLNYGGTFVNGSPHQIHLRTIPSLVVLITREPQPGSFKEAYIMNGNQHLRFSGSMENVRLCHNFFYLTPPHGILCLAGAGKSILWFVAPLLRLVVLQMTDVVYYLPVLQSSKISK